MLSATIFPFGVRESSQSAFDTTVIGIAIPTQSEDRHCWFYGKPTLLQLFEGGGLCVGHCRQHRFRCLPRFAAELFPQLCSADVLAVSTVSSSFTFVCLAGLPRFRLTATLYPTRFSACVLGSSMLVCFDMVGSALSHFSCDESNDDVCRVPVL